MADLTGRKRQDTYKDLLQVSNGNSGVDGTLRRVEDGEGTESALSLSETAGKITGNFEVTGTFTGGVAAANLTGQVPIANGGTGAATAAAARTALGFSDPILDKASPGNIGATTPGTGAFTTLTASGVIDTSNAAGPALLDEAATVTNPTLIPNKADPDTGLGWPATNYLSLITAGVDALVIDSSQRAIFGHNANLTVANANNLHQILGVNAASNIVGFSNDVNGPSLNLASTRSTTIGTAGTVVGSGDTLGNIRFLADDGTDLNSTAASIVGMMDGTPASNDVPGSLRFSTTSAGSNSPTLALKIDSSQNATFAGGIDIANADPWFRLSRDGASGYAEIATNTVGELIYASDRAGGGNGYHEWREGSTKLMDLDHNGNLETTGNIEVSNAAGPTLLNEAASSTNPTVIPNKADDDTGLGWTSANKMAFIAGGSLVAEYSSSGLNVNNTGGASTPSIYFGGQTDTGIWRSASQNLDFSSAGVLRVNLDNAGNITLGTGAIATTATDGFLYIPSCAGTPTGTPTTKTGRTALVYDSTNNLLYANDGGGWAAV